jgi:isoquinoline 1-oxidoreductase alpha subunit
MLDATNRRGAPLANSNMTIVMSWRALDMRKSYTIPIIKYAETLEVTMAINIKVNGVPHSVDVDDDTPLLWVLRDVLGMTGTKFGCGLALCGACTIHIDGKPARSCVTPIAAAAGKRITTIEAIGATAAGKKIQQAWIELDVPQCGYCQSGQIMSAAALLTAKPKPSDADIDAAMSGNVCRCGTYARIREGIKRAAQGVTSDKKGA